MPVEFVTVGEGWSLLLAKLRDLPVSVAIGLGEAAKTMRNQIEGSTPVSDRATRGTLQSGWSEVMATPSSFSFSNAVHYGPILEEGRYPNMVSGPRTQPGTRGDGLSGMFSSQAVGGMVTPWFYDAVKLNLIVDTIIEAMNRYLEGVGGTVART